MFLLKSQKDDNSIYIMHDKIENFVAIDSVICKIHNELPLNQKNSGEFVLSMTDHKAIFEGLEILSKTELKFCWETSFRQFQTWLLPGLRKMLTLIISNTKWCHSVGLSCNFIRPGRSHVWNWRKLVSQQNLSSVFEKIPNLHYIKQNEKHPW